MIDTEYELPVKRRATRRHHKDRIKNKTRRVFKEVWNDRGMLKEDIVGRWCDNLARCSCGMCGNKRKWEGKTLQERKARLYETDYWNEDISDEWLWEEMSDSYWGWLSDYAMNKDYCCLCDKEFIGMCPSCGYRPDYW